MEMLDCKRRTHLEGQVLYSISEHEAPSTWPLRGSGGSLAKSMKGMDGITDCRSLLTQGRQIVSGVHVVSR